jgi:hypothetical protein
MSRRLIVAIVAVAAMSIAGCGSSHQNSGQSSVGATTNSAATKGATGGDSPSAAPSAAAGGQPANGGSLDPCSMLTTAQVASALGEAPGAGKQEPNFDTPECEWEPASGHNGTVTVDVGPWVGDPGIKPLRLGTPVSGIGDEAYDSGNTGLFVRKGSNGLRVWVFNVKTQSSRLDLEKQLATILLAKI